MPLTSHRKIDRALLLKQHTTYKMNKELISASATSPIEKSLLGLFEQLLGIDGIGIEDDFFELGGHSLLLIHLAMAIETKFKKSISLNQIVMQPTIAGIAKAIEEPVNSELNSILKLNTNTDGIPIFFIHETSGFVSWYTGLATLFNDSHPVYAIQDPTINSTSAYASIEEMASSYIKIIRKHYPQGPVILGGWCMGGIIAYEMAQQLLKEHAEKSTLILIDTPADVSLNTIKKSAQQEIDDIKKSFIELQAFNTHNIPLDNKDLLHQHIEKMVHRITLMRRYKPSNYLGKVIMICAALATEISSVIDCNRWKALIEQLIVHQIKATHYNLLKKPHVVELMTLIKKSLSM